MGYACFPSRTPRWAATSGRTWSSWVRWRGGRTCRRPAGRTAQSCRRRRRAGNRVEHAAASGAGNGSDSRTWCLQGIREGSHVRDEGFIWICYHEYSKPAIHPVLQYTLYSHTPCTPRHPVFAYTLYSHTRCTRRHPVLPYTLYSHTPCTRIRPVIACTLYSHTPRIPCTDCVFYKIFNEYILCILHH